MPPTGSRGIDPAADSAPVRWGVLGAASIALRAVIPAMQQSARCRVVAIASRDPAKARAAADSLGIPRVLGSYDALIADPDIEAIYNPLPNHLHVPWSIRAAEAGKHVLCEKPLALSAAEARTLQSVQRRTGVQIGEAFMTRTHPQWERVRELIEAGRIGELRLITGHFSYLRRGAGDIRSRADWGGGAMLDIGGYPVTMARWLFRSEPESVVALVERDPEFTVDRLTSALLRFPSGQAAFTCGGDLAPFQRMQLFGSTGRIDVETPFTPAADRAGRLYVDDARRAPGASMETIEIPAVNQYLLQADRFSEAIRGRGQVPVPVDDAIRNMAVIDALFRSAETGRWETPAGA